MNTIAVPLHVTLSAGTVKLVTEASEPFNHAISVLRHLQNGVLGEHSSGTKGGSWRVLNQDCRRYEVEQIPGADFCR